MTSPANLSVATSAQTAQSASPLNIGAPNWISEAEPSKTSSPRILHIAETIKGGVGTYLAELIPLQLGEWGPSNIRLLVPEEQKSQIAIISDRVVATFRRNGRSVSSLLTLAKRAADEVRSFRPDIIHVHSTFAGFVVRLLFGWRTKRPTIVYCPHGWAFSMDGASWKRALYRRCERVMAMLCDRVVAISAHEAMLAAEIGVRPSHYRVVKNGIDAQGPEPLRRPWFDRRIKLLFIGRLDRQKGLDVLLAAMQGLEDQVALRVVGEAVASKAPHKNVQANIEWLGWLAPSEIAGAMADAEIVVIPSRWEGFGLVALEAMRAGKMVIASAVGGLTEVVQDGVTGRLVPAEDVDALRGALMLDDTAMRANMGARGRERFLAHFTSERMHQEISALYRDALATRPGPSLVLDQTIFSERSRA